MTTSSRITLFDAHAHLVADDQQAYPRNPMQRAANAPPRLPGVIGKPGGHHGPQPINEVPDVSRMLEWMAHEGVDGAVAVQKRMIYRYDNSYILDSSDRHPDIFSAVVILDAEDAGTAPLVRRYITEHGLAGVRLFGGRGADGGMPWLNSPMALKTWEVAQAHGLVMDLEVLAIGGWGADGFSQAASTADGRARFVDSTLVLMERYGFLGVDIDWEYPGSSAAGIASSANDRKNFTLLLQALREGS